MNSLSAKDRIRIYGSDHVALEYSSIGEVECHVLLGGLGPVVQDITRFRQILGAKYA